MSLENSTNKRNILKLSCDKSEMRIAAISDIHYPTENVAFKYAIRHINSCGDVDVLMVAGDLFSFDNKLLNECLKILGLVKAKYRLIVPGNHDLWSNVSTRLIDDRAKEINQIYNLYGYHNLENGPVIIGSLGFIGNIGWYDGSFHPKLTPDPYFYNYKKEKKRFSEFTTDDFEKQIYYAEVEDKIFLLGWNDINYFNKTISDVEYCHLKVKQMEQDIELIKNRTRKLIAMTHTVPHIIGVSKYSSKDAPIYAWHGSDEYRKLYEKHKVILAVFGHEHLPKSFNDKGVNYRSAVLRYTGKVPVLKIKQ